ncbi:MAG TPA: FtsX-like permease family protein [Planctomycetota bacterium]|nr:FtsX-like permease family protein [Planctomycetota bacterium]
MNVARFALRSLSSRRLSTVLTALGVALGVGLVVFVVTVRGASRSAFDDAARGYDVVLGGVQTSSLTTVMNTVFHVDQPVDTVDVEVLVDVKADPRVRYAVPYAVGDVYRGHRVVGTSSQFFDAIADAEGKPLRERLIPGSRIFPDDGEFEAVVGGIAAARTGLTIGSEFKVTHGMEEGGHQHEDVWKVVGVLAPTGTPNDRAIFITLESFFHVEGHEAPATPPPGTSGNGAGHDGHEGEGAPEDQGPVYAVSSIVVRLKSPALRFQFAADWNRRKDVRAALPSREVGRLFEVVQNVDALLRAVAVLVLVVAGLSILVGLYNTIAGRRREIAILRALGARPRHVVSVVVLESVVTCLAGGLLGLVLGHAAVAASAPLLLEKVGIRITAAPLGFGLYALVAGGLLVLGLLAGALPAWRAFRTPVAENLHPVD